MNFPPFHDLRSDSNPPPSASFLPVDSSGSTFHHLRSDSNQPRPGPSAASIMSSAHKTNGVQQVVVNSAAPFYDLPRAPQGCWRVQPTSGLREFPAPSHPPVPVGSLNRSTTSFYPALQPPQEVFRSQPLYPPLSGLASAHASAPQPNPVRDDRTSGGSSEAFKAFHDLKKTHH